MTEESLATGYAQALFEVASKRGGADDIEKDLEGIKELLKSNKEFRDILYHPSITKTDKKDIINKTIGHQCSSKWVRNLLYILIDKRREKILDFLPDVFKGVAGQIRGVVSVKVQTAFPLTGTRRVKLKENIEKLTKKKVEKYSCHGISKPRFLPTPPDIHSRPRQNASGWRTTLTGRQAGCT